MHVLRLEANCDASLDWARLRAESAWIGAEATSLAVLNDVEFDSKENATVPSQPYDRTLIRWSRRHGDGRTVSARPSFPNGTEVL